MVQLNPVPVFGAKITIKITVPFDRKFHRNFRTNGKRSMIVACSLLQTIKCGVSRGSILRPLLFILYINDLPNASKLTQPMLFADDASIFYSH